MKLYEFEGKELFKKVGIAVPASFLISQGTRPKGLITKLTQLNKIPQNFFPAVLKVQVLSGDRARRGGILFCKNIRDLQFRAKKLLGSDFDGEKITKVLVEEKIKIDVEYFFSVTYATNFRAPVILVSKKAGTGISEFEKRFLLNPLEEFNNQTAEKFLTKAKFPKEEIKKLSKILAKFVKFFYDFDCRLAEINPLAKSNGEFFAIDAKIILDDAAQFRHPELKLTPRTATGAAPTKAEIEAKKIDENDHRGVAGSVYFDLEGDIGILASGGGG